MDGELVDPQLVVKNRAIVGEGSLWDAQKKVMYWVDIIGHVVHIYDPQTKQNRTIQTCQSVGTVVPRAKGGLAVAMHNGFATIDLETEKITPIADPERDVPGNRFNEGKCDPAGRFWAGTMDDNHTDPCGSLYRLDSDLGFSVQETGIVISNSTAFSPDGGTLYYCDTLNKEIWTYDLYVDGGEISNRRVFASTKQMAGGPDGSTVDAEGYLWNAMWGGACLIRWAPNGSFDRKIDLPVHNPTCPMFGSDDLDIIYVTSARVELSDAQLAEKPFAGNILAVTGCGVTGLPEPRFAG